MLPRRDGARRRSQLRLERRRRRLRQEMRTLGVGRVEGQEQPQRQEQPQERQEQHQRDEQQWEPPRQEQQRRRALRAAGEGLYEGPVRVLLLSDSVDRYVLQFWWVVGAGGRGLGVLRGGGRGGRTAAQR
jgi:broad specificity phosphatase PhoE